MTLTAGILATGGVSNTVTASATAPDGAPVTDILDAGDDTDGNTSDDATVTTLGVSRLLAASKTVDRTSAVKGETVSFTRTFENGTAIAYTGASFVEQLPPGLTDTPGAARVDGVAGVRLVITLQARVSPSAQPGTLTNRTYMLDVPGQVVTNVATATIRIVSGAVFDCSDVIGKVFVDRNGNGVQDPDAGRAAASDPEIFRTVNAPNAQKTQFQH